MAKIIGYSERLSFDNYDCFSPRDLQGTSYQIKLFGGHSADRERTMVVRDWYARTNLSALPDNARSAWHAWASITTVSLVVGVMPVLTMPLGRLFARQRHGQDERKVKVNCEASTAKLADRLRLAHDPWARLASISDDERDKWLRVAHQALYLLEAPAYAHIPERQNYSVMVDTDQRALAAMLEVMPTNVAPQALVWVHLAGFSIMEVETETRPTS